jgi:glycosyltransferase involved in cell wall biosynthesis
MRIGYILSSFPPLSETFIRREILALRAAGHRMFVYTHRLYHDPLVPDLSESELVIRQIPFLKDAAALVRAVQADGIEHLHSSLMIAAQRSTYQVACKLQIPFSLTVYSGHDVFSARDPQLYREMTACPLCAAVMVEDPFMRDFVVERLGACGEKTVLVANAFDLETYGLAAPRTPRERVIILAIARFVEKKGLIYLIEAFARLSARRSDVELWIVGQGPEEAQLRRAAGSNPRIKFLGLQSEAQTRRTYADADIFCLPCVQTPQGDADGVPTTVLEAMAFELPIVSSNLLSLPYYVRDGQEGILTPPRDVVAITAALEALSSDAERRQRMGRAGRARVAELCNLSRNIRLIETTIVASRRRRWEHKQAEVAQDRPLVSIAITCFNRVGMIRRCIDSALAQIYRPIEIVVVDDGSSDGTRQIIESYGSALKVVCHEQNRGRVAAKNSALLATSPSARYVAILDSDDYYHPNFAQRCVDFLERRSGVGLVYTDDILVNDHGRELRRQSAVEPWSIDVWLRTRNLRGDTWLARRELVMQTALHDELVPLDEDYDLLYQLLELTTFAHLPEHLVSIRSHDDYTQADRLALARCHAANLVKYGYSPEYALLRARANPEWLPAIKEGIALGRMLRERREQVAAEERAP